MVSIWCLIFSWWSIQIYSGRVEESIFVDVYLDNFDFIYGVVLEDLEFLGFC